MNRALLDAIEEIIEEGKKAWRDNFEELSKLPLDKKIKELSLIRRDISEEEYKVVFRDYLKKEDIKRKIETFIKSPLFWVGIVFLSSIFLGYLIFKEDDKKDIFFEEMKKIHTLSDIEECLESKRMMIENKEGNLKPACVLWIPENIE